MLGRIGSPRPPSFGPCDHLSGAGPASSDRANARRSPISAAGKASGSRRTRMAMYCAVHSPMPRIERSLAIASSELRWTEKFGFAEAAVAMMIALAHEQPASQANWLARSGGVGNMCVSPSPERSVRFAMLGDELRSIFTAATTVICWPSIARTATSNRPSAWDVRRPGRFATSGASSGSRRRSSLMAAGPRSDRNAPDTANDARQRADLRKADRHPQAGSRSSGSTPITPSHRPAHGGDSIGGRRRLRCL